MTHESEGGASRSGEVGGESPAWHGFAVGSGGLAGVFAGKAAKAPRSSVRRGGAGHLGTRYSVKGARSVGRKSKLT